MDPSLLTQPDIFIFGIRVQEAMNVLTDIFLATVSFYAYYKLPKTTDRAQNLMKWYFLIFGLGALIGGIVGHAFLYAYSNYWRLLGWSFTALSALILELAALEQAKDLLKPSFAKALKPFIYVEFVVIIILTALDVDFKYITIHSAIAMMLVFTPIQIYVYRKTKNLGSKYMLYSVLVLISTLAVFKIPIVIHQWFNHKDLAHVVVALSVLFMLKGAQLYHQRKAN